MSTRPNLSGLQIFAYGLPGLPLAAVYLPLVVFLPTFYSRDLGLELAVVGGVLLLARLWDVVTDPIIGGLSDRFDSRFGRRRPWLLIGAPVLALSIYALFIPTAPVGGGYLLVWAMVLYLAWTAITLPYQAWGAELSDEYHGRSRLTAARETCVLLGTLLTLALPMILSISVIEAGAGVMNAIAWVTIGLLPITIGIALAVVPDSRVGLRAPVGFRQGLRVMAANRPFRRLLLAWLVNGAANGFPATLFILFVTHGLGLPDKAGLLLFVYFLAGVAGVPVWLLISYRLGKHRTWALAMLWASLAFVWVPLLGVGDFWAFLAISILSGLALGADLSLPSSIQADVIDVDALQTGTRRSGIYFALWGMATKLSLALAVGIAFPLLGLVGFSTDGGNEPMALTVLALLYGLVPVGLKLIATAIVWNFPLDSDAQAEMRQRLKSGASENA